MVITLSAQKREVVGKKTAELRSEGVLPAVLYGAKDDSTAIQLSSKEFGKAWKEAGESTIIELTVDGDKKNVLIYDVDLDPLSHEPRHADFYIIQKGQKVEVSVPLEFIGDSKAVKELGANLVKVLHEVEIEAEATNLPHEINVDISVLANINDQILAKDIALPAGVTLVTAPEEVVALIQEAREEEEETSTEVDMSQIGISEERGKKEEEEGEAADKAE